MRYYNDYFRLKHYWPEITQETFSKEPAAWKRTYPHKTFVGLLKRVEKMLARGSEMDKHSIWIHGAYGTGKSQVTWALRSLLTCDDGEFEEYFDEYEPLRAESDLKRKLEGHRKSRKIVVAVRHGSDAINGPDDLIEAVYESLSKALDDAGIRYDASATIRGGIIKWLEGNGKELLDVLIKKEPYCHMGCFGGKTSEDILETLKGDGSADELIKEIRRLAKAEGLSALRFSKDDLMNWIHDTVDGNDIHLLLVWDEFSAFFKNNKTKLDTLQALAELSAGTRFNLVIVTHFTTSFLPEGDNSSRIIVDRFKPTVEISLPENIAFDLIGHALTVKNEFKADWGRLAESLNSRMEKPRLGIAKMLKDVDEKTFRLMLPFHPYAALVLKNIAALFDSNQRSMFTFIADDDPETKAFKWFIMNHSPDNGDVLSVDMLWEYFYRTGKNLQGEAGRSNLDAQVRAILDVYPSGSSKLIEKEKRVLKTVLIFQALAKKLNNQREFLATEENLRLAFEGVDDLEMGAGIHLAGSLVARKILFEDEVNGQKVFQAPMATNGLALQEIDRLKTQLVQSTKTRELIKEWNPEDVLRLSRPLEIRFDTRLAAPDSFKTVLEQSLSQETKNYRMRTIIVIGRTDVEAVNAREAINKALDDPRSAETVFIDATATNLSDDDFSKWAEYKARADWYARKDAQQSNNALNEAGKILTAWRDRMTAGQFTVYSVRRPQGEICHGPEEVLDELRFCVLKKYPLAMEFGKGARLTETLFNQAGTKDVIAGIRGGIDHLRQGEKKERITEKDEKALLEGVKDISEYWKTAPALTLSKIKTELVNLMDAAFRAGGKGRVEFGEIVETLFGKGFMPTDLHGYLSGFLLKEYIDGDYRFCRDGESVPLDAEHLAEGVLCYFKKVQGSGGRYHDAFIEVLTAEQRRFADLAKTVFKLGDNASIDIVAQHLAARIREFQYPLWCFEALPEAADLERYIDQFTVLTNPANQKGASLADVATKIGKMAEADPEAEKKLSQLFTKENARRAMSAWLNAFEDGAFRAVVDEIKVDDPLADVRQCFGVEGTWLWHRDTGEGAIRNLLRDYRIVAESYKCGFLTAPTASFKDCITAWRDKTRTIRMSCDVLVALKPESKEFLGLLKEIADGGELEQNSRRDAFYREITKNADFNRKTLDSCLSLFREAYSEKLSGLDEQETDSLYQELGMSSFLHDKQRYEDVLDKKIAEVRRNQGKTKLRSLWKKKTSTDTPAAWSKRYMTPISALIPEESALAANLHKALDVVDDDMATAARVAEAHEFFETHPEVFEWFDGKKADSAFRKRVIGRYGAVLTSLENVRKELLRKLGPEIGRWLADDRRELELEKLAQKEYNQHCAERVHKKIAEMDAADAKAYLERLVRDSLDVGLAILSKE